MRPTHAFALALLLVLVQASCINAFYQRELHFQPPPSGAMAELVPGQSDLGLCLQQLGAPLWVWEYQGSGAVLAYGWRKSGDWNISLSAPIASDASASLTYRQIDARMRGVLLFFDPDWKLRAIRKGLLRDLSARFQNRRPAFEVDD